MIMDKKEALKLVSWLSIEIKKANIETRKNGNSGEYPLNVSIPSSMVQDTIEALDSVFDDSIGEQDKKEIK